MTEKRYDYSELKDGTYGVFKDKYHDDIDISFSQRFCIVENEEQARSIVGQLNSLVDENEKLKQENQQYKSLLRDMGLLMSGEDVMAIRNNFADKIIKPIFAESGFDVDVDTSNGFAISLKEEKE